MRPRSTAALGLLLLVGGCAGSRAPAVTDAAPAPVANTAPTPTDLARLSTLVSFMSGSFDSAEQAKADPAYYDTRLHVVPIWVDYSSPNPDAKWLYVEAAMADQLGKPYRQRIFRLSALGGGRYKVEINELPGNPLPFAGAWRNTGAFKDLSPKDLIPSEGCFLILADRKDAFIGGTQGHDCTKSLNGAAYTTSEQTVTANALVSWDRGFDENGKQVWGAPKGGYIFRKRAR